MKLNRNNLQNSSNVEQIAAYRKIKKIAGVTGEDLSNG